jgi:hypothetical protein
MSFLSFSWTSEGGKLSHISRRHDIVRKVNARRFRVCCSYDVSGHCDCFLQTHQCAGSHREKGAIFLNVNSVPENFLKSPGVVSTVVAFWEAPGCGEDGCHRASRRRTLYCEGFFGSFILWWMLIRFELSVRHCLCGIRIEEMQKVRDSIHSHSSSHSTSITTQTRQP